MRSRQICLQTIGSSEMSFATSRSDAEEDRRRMAQSRHRRIILLFWHDHTLPKTSVRSQESYDNATRQDKMNLMSLPSLWLREKALKLLRAV